MRPAMQGGASFGADGQATWRAVLESHRATRGGQVYELFDQGIDALGISSEEIPDLEKVNEKLLKLTGFQGVFVSGLEDGETFFAMLSRRLFPVGKFIRSQQDLNYTPEPDIVHDLYGHLPFLTDWQYADFCQELGARARAFRERKDLLRQFERFFWFTIEFGLIKTPAGVRVFGAGIASSVSECRYALSGEPQVLPFDVDVIRRQEFRIDQMQTKLFLLESTQQLYSSLEELSSKVSEDL